MTRLNKLLLGSNDLVGTIPPSLGNLSSLQNITVARNHLVGSIPHVLGRLSNLKELNLGLNNLSGSPRPLLSSLLPPPFHRTPTPDPSRDCRRQLMAVLVKEHGMELSASSTTDHGFMVLSDDAIAASDAFTHDDPDTAA
ncbi:uncharacterized protein HKW66_Vig0130190 [Vigna angularis]|uniref:Leucine-rich repeat-containing N-terminal plant-type domain-containing protein n=1 Tax=Phaseolus angularis TaxID=3914 RepID=A0A8T0K2A7_PHAAN|nr:uncharacterized protein HKW66_Vig0130190 [Vigna angularis]